MTTSGSHSNTFVKRRGGAQAELYLGNSIVTNVLNCFAKSAL